MEEMTVVPMPGQAPEGDWPMPPSATPEVQETAEPVAVKVDITKAPKLPPDDTIKKFTEKSNTDLTNYQTQRDEIDDRNEVADYMYQAAQNSAITATEKSKGMDVPDDSRANVGSVLFHRQVNQLASQLATVLYRGPLFRYSPRTTETVIGSGEDSIDLAAQANGLAKWNLDRINWGKKVPEFAQSLFKYSDIFVACSWTELMKRKMAKKPVIEFRQTPDGLVPFTTGDVIEITQAKESYLDFFLLHADQLWADRTLPDIQSQNCVIVGRLRIRSEIYAEVLSGNFNEDQYDKITASHAYNGQYMDRSAKTENKNQTRENNSEDVFMQWDIFRRAPIDEKGKWDDKNPSELWWGTVIGNDISSGILVRLERNPDPDDEIPIQDVHVYPDDSGDLYKTSMADVVRSLYSTDCTLLNMALDNAGMINEPPLLVVDGMHHIKDFSFRRAAKWSVDDVERAVKEFPIRPTSLQTVQMRQMVVEEAMTALATDKPMMGMSHGARTSATEASAITQNSIQPHMVQIRYIVYQLAPWMAKKLMSYWQVYGDPRQVYKITEMNKVYEVSPKNLIGEFDVQVEIVDEYIDDTVRQARVMQFLNILSASPWLQQSPRHRVDPAELLHQAFQDFRFNPSRIVSRTGSADSEKVARLENVAMIQGGQYDQPQQGEDHETHLKIHRYERTRWNGIEDQPEAKNVALLDQHIAMHQQIQGQEQQAAQQVRMTQNRTPGQFAGNEMAAQAGAETGGGVAEVAT